MNINKRVVQLVSATLLFAPVYLHSLNVEAKEEAPKIENVSKTQKKMAVAAVTPLSGLNGTSTWNLDANGVLTINAGEMETAVLVPAAQKADVTKIVINGKVFAPKFSSSLFSGYSNVTEFIGLKNLDTSNVTLMSSMFQNMSSLEKIDLTGFNTSSVTSMTYMFYGASSLKELNVSNFDTSKVTNMSYMFAYSGELTSLDLSSFDTSNVKNMSYMFYSSAKLTNLDLKNFNTSSVTNMSSMFSRVSSIINLNLSSFDTSSVTIMAGMFGNTTNLRKLDISSFNTSKVTNMSSMFSGSGIEELDLTNFNSQSIILSTNMTSSMKNLKSIRVGEYWREKLTFNTPSKTGDYTGDWFNVDTMETYTSAQLNSLDSIPPGKYEWIENKILL